MCVRKKIKYTEGCKSPVEIRLPSGHTIYDYEDNGDNLHQWVNFQGTKISKKQLNIYIKSIKWMKK